MEKIKLSRFKYKNYQKQNKAIINPRRYLNYFIYFAYYFPFYQVLYLELTIQI